MSNLANQRNMLLNHYLGGGRPAHPANQPQHPGAPGMPANQAPPVPHPGQFAWGGINWNSPEEAVAWMNSHGAHTTVEQFLQNHPALAAQYGQRTAQPAMPPGLGGPPATAPIDPAAMAAAGVGYVPQGSSGFLTGYQNPPPPPASGQGQPYYGHQGTPPRHPRKPLLHAYLSGG